MKKLLFLFPLLVGSVCAAEGPSAALASGLARPRSAAVGGDGRVYVSVGDAVQILDRGQAKPFATGLDEPTGLAVHGDWVYAADRQRVWRIDRQGKASVHVAATAFPVAPKALGELAVDPESGTLFVADVGGAIYRIPPRGRAEGVFGAGAKSPLGTPGGLVLDGATHLLAADASTGTLWRIKLTDQSTEKVADGLGSADGLAWDHFGRLLIADRKGGRVLVLPRPGERPVVLRDGLAEPADVCLAPGGREVLVVAARSGTVAVLPIRVPGSEVDTTPLPVESVVAFPDLKWTGWQPETTAGKPNPLRPIVLTHASDGSNRVFVATQHGVIHAFSNDPKATATRIFLDIAERVRYDDKENEEGFLGLAFHPRYKENREFYVFYTPRSAKKTNLVSRFRTRADDPERADPASEEVILRIEGRPFWNHDGGTVCFGPDGHLYVAIGDGGLANDPFDNAQNLKNWFGKVLRIDVDHKDPGRNYAVPKDNPFVERSEARPEIWAYGLRNVWRMAFDRATGQLWAADVGQNLWEEINHLRKGGNFGWNRRESLHPFGPRGSGPRPEFVDPIWEYHHDIGKSITGGHVYRGKQLPALTGSYLYGDYVSGKIWALRHDERLGRVIANRPIRDRSLPLLSFGEDERGEVYYLTHTTTGQGVYRFVEVKAGGK